MEYCPKKNWTFRGHRGILLHFPEKLMLLESLPDYFQRGKLNGKVLILDKYGECDSSIMFEDGKAMISGKHK